MTTAASIPMHNVYRALGRVRAPSSRASATRPIRSKRVESGLFKIQAKYKMIVHELQARLIPLAKILH